MKYLFLLAFSLPIFSFAQPYALVHRQMMQPIEVSDSLQWSKIAGRYFPVKTSDLDLLINTLDQYIDSLHRGENNLIEKEVLMGSSRLLVHKNDLRDPGYSVLLFTRTKEYGFTLELVKRGDTNRRALQKLKAFLYYLRNNRLLVQEQTGLQRQTL